MAVQQWQKYLAELLGSFILVFVGVLGLLAADLAGVSRLLVAPFSFGLGLLAGLYAFGEVSGGHFNPAVTLAMFLDRRVSMSDLIGYWIAQIVGVVLAAGLLALMFNTDAVAGGATVPGEPGDGAALWTELVLTAVFVTTFLMSTRTTRFSTSALVAISLALVAVHFAGLPISGASVNPARSFGPALVGTEWDGFWIYLVGPFAGAIVAWLAHLVVVRGDTDLADDLREIKEAAKPER